MEFKKAYELTSTESAYSICDIENITDFKYFEKAVWNLLEHQYDIYMDENKAFQLHPTFIILDSFYYPANFKEVPFGRKEFGSRIIMINTQTKENFPISVSSFTYQQMATIDILDMYNTITFLKFRFLKQKRLNINPHSS